MEYDVAVFIGRFQPFHKGHEDVIKEALKRANKVIILIGSSFAPRSYRNPFTYIERLNMIKNSFSYDDAARLNINPLMDYPYNDNQWVEEIQFVVNEYSSDNQKIALIGHSKDHTSYYLKMFPQWDSINVSMINCVDATTIRQSYFSHVPVWTEFSPKGTKDFLDKFYQSAEYKDIVAEYDFIENYKRSWSHAPYAPIFVTVDACVVQSGHVLLVKRKARPGKGTLALPGGFVNSSEKLVDAMIRELKEETKIKVPAPVLRGNIICNHVYDEPHRSSRGRTITHAFLINLKGDKQLPKIIGSDDAEKAMWIALSSLKSENFFEDHFGIINHLKNKGGI